MFRRIAERSGAGRVKGSWFSWLPAAPEMMYVVAGMSVVLWVVLPESHGLRMLGCGATCRQDTGPERVRSRSGAALPVSCGSSRGYACIKHAFIVVLVPAHVEVDAVLVEERLEAVLAARAVAHGRGRAIAVAVARAVCRSPRALSGMARSKGPCGG